MPTSSNEKKKEHLINEREILLETSIVQVYINTPMTNIVPIGCLLFQIVIVYVSLGRDNKPKRIGSFLPRC